MAYQEEAFTLRATANFVTDENTRDFDCGNFDSFYLVVVTGTRAGTITLTPTLQMKLPDGTYLTLQAAAAAIAAAGTVVYYFGIFAGGANFTGIAEPHPGPIPRTCRFFLDSGGTGNWDVTCYVVPTS